MKLCHQGIQNRAAWEQAGIRLPAFDWKAMRTETDRNPVWVHFGAGNIFRGFIAKLQQDLLEQGLVNSGITAADTFDYGIIDQIYTPFDSMTLMVSLLPDGSMDKEVIASVAQGLRAGSAYPGDMERLKEIFRSPSLQMVSYTITEKGYALTNIHGEYFPFVQADFEKGPGSCSHAMSMTTALLWERFRAGGAPIAVVSMDNCSHNGEKLRTGVMAVVEQWLDRGHVTPEFAVWVANENKVSFPWSMIDKITPRPAKVVEEALAGLGVEDMAPIVTEKGTFIAPFVNAERPQYLVVEDRFPNGRPPLEKAGVYMTDRNTVNKTEKMKVTTCLNPLHTALAVFGFIQRSKAGTFINQIDNIVNIAPFSITVENSDLSDLLEFRYMLEGETANYAAKRATPEDISQLEYSYGKMIEFRHDVNQFVDYDAMFHMQVSAATHNKLLMSTMIAAKDSFEKGIRLSLRESLTQNPRVIDVTIELHGKIIEAIKNGDYQTAYTAMREHISYVNLTVKYG